MNETDTDQRQMQAPLVFKRDGMNTLIVDADVIAPLFWEYQHQQAWLGNVRGAGL